MIARAIIALAIVARAAGLAQSPQTCPWLSAGTAAKILGSDVTVTAHSDSNWSGSCRFATSNAPVARIEINVGRTDTHPCGPGATPLSAIGNQAVLCSAKDADGQNVQTVSGQVRDAWFVVVLTRPAAKSQEASSKEENTGSSTIDFLAEQIAGNLY